MVQKSKHRGLKDHDHQDSDHTAAVLAGAAAADASESPIQIVLEEGKPVARFKIGDARCVLMNDQIRCTAATK